MTNTSVERNFIEVDFNPFEDGKEIEKTIAINEPQREIWLSCMLGGESANLAYNESVSLDLHGDLNVDAFRDAVKEMVARHEALRSTVSANGESIIIYKHLPFHTQVVDISSAKDQAALLRDFISQQMLQTFDLLEGPFIRTFLHKLSDTHYYFTLVGHHIACDGWSIGVMLEDISKIYNAKVKHQPAKLDKADQISDYVVEMAYFRGNGTYEQTKNYWLDIYKDGAPTVDFPTDFSRPQLRSYKSHRLDREMPVQLMEQLKQTGIKYGCSFVNTLLSAFEIFLYLKTNQQDLVVGMPSAGQASTGKFSLVGHCVNLLALKSHVEPNISFNNYLQKRKSSFFAAYENQNFTFGELIQVLNLKRDNSRIPLSPIVFNVDMGMDYSVAFDGLTYKLISNPRAFETFEIFLNVTGSKSSYLFEWSYNTQLFKPETIEKIAIEFEDLLKAIIADPDITVNQLKIKNTDEWTLQLNKWNNTAVNYDRSLSVTALIDDAAVKYTNQPAISFKGESITYTQLAELSDKLANYLISKDIKPGDIIGLAADRSIEMVVSLVAILKAGAAYVPLDPEYPKERIEFMLADSDAKMVLVSKAYKGNFASNADELIIEDIWPAIINSPLQKPSVTVKGNDLAYVLYTSGSTGKPKGVKIKHFNLVNFLFSLQDKPGITSADKMLAITTISFDVAGMEIFLPLVTGAEIVLGDRESAKDPQALLDIVEKQNITIMSATPSTWRMLVDNGWTKKYPLKVWTAGEALSRELANALLPLCGELWNLYGPTETTIISILKQIKATDEQITIGWPINNTQIYICDEQNQPVLPGQIGEILIGGDGVAEGYLNREELTAERFIKDPFTNTPNAKLYKTGDLGKFSNDGDIQYLGRADNQVKVRGIRIEPGEIETLLAAQENVKQSVVIAREDTPGDSRLVAYVILKTATDNTKTLIDSWKEALKIALPPFMVPGNFVIMDAFPLTPNNKIDKKALPKPQLINTHFEDQTRHPVTENEKLIFEIWSDLLGVKNIGIDDDFFEIGGHSILAVKMMSEIEKKVGKRFPLSILLQNSTISKLAERIQSVEHEDEKWDTLVPIKTSGTKTPVYLIHGGGLNILLFKSLNKFFDDDQPVYGIQAFGLTRPTEIPPTIEEAARRHIIEILQNDPNGPYALAGYSLGGYIAFEIAKQLKAMGKEVTLLGIIDTYAVSNLPQPMSAVVAKKIKRQFTKIPYFVKSFLNRPIESIVYQYTSITHKLQHIFTPEVVIAKEVLTPAETEIYKVYEHAYDTYILTPLDLPIHLFRVKKRLYYLDDLVYLGWDKFTTKKVDIHEIPGDHKTFLYPPNDQEFAHIVQNVLNAHSS